MGQNWPRVTFYAHQKISRMVEHHNENKPGHSILPAPPSSSWPMTICNIISPNFLYEKMPPLAIVMLAGQSTVKAKNRMKMGHDDESIAFLDFKGYSEPAISRMPKTLFRLTTMPSPWWRQPEPKRNSAWRAACVLFHITPGNDSDRSRNLRPHVDYLIICLIVSRSEVGDKIVQRSGITFPEAIFWAVSKAKNTGNQRIKG